MYTGQHWGKINVNVSQLHTCTCTYSNIHTPVLDKRFDIWADKGLRADNSLDDQVLDGVPHFVRVDAKLRPHVAPESKETPFVTLTDRFVRVWSELWVLFVNTVQVKVDK